MRKILIVDGINISITVQDLTDMPHLKQYSSKKYGIWCHDENWDVAQEDLVWILRDKVHSYLQLPYSKLLTERDRRLWKTYQCLVQKGFSYKPIDK